MNQVVWIIAFISTLRILLGVLLRLQGVLIRFVNLFLILLIIVSSGFTFYRFGPVAGVLSIVIPFLLLNYMLGLLAAVIAERVLGLRVGLHESPLRRLTPRAFSDPTGWEFMQNLERAAVDSRQQLEVLSSRPTIRVILQKHALDLDGLERFYTGLLASGLEDIAMDIMSDPAQLDRALTMNKQVRTRDDTLRFADSLRHRSR